MGDAVSASRRTAAQLVPLVQLYAAGERKRALAKIGRGFWSTKMWYGLKKDLTARHETPVSLADFTVRPIAPGDAERLLREDDGDDLHQILHQRRLLAADVPTCWVAVLDDGEPCFMQWLITPADNQRLADAFGAEFPQLMDHQVLLEGAFTPRRFRDQRIAARAISLITKQAPSKATEAWTYVMGMDSPQRPRPSTRAGFKPALVKRSRRRCCFKLVDFHELDLGHPVG